jgi:hypothetical protein
MANSPDTQPIFDCRDLAIRKVCRLRGKRTETAIPKYAQIPAYKIEFARFLQAPIDHHSATGVTS